MRLREALSPIFEGITVFRGVEGKFDPNRSGDVMWVSTSMEHSAMYAAGGDIVQFKLNNRLKEIDFGFRSAETSVTFDELQGRLKLAIMKQFKDGNLSRDKAMKLVDQLDGINQTGHNPVWLWLQNKEITRLIRQAGFNAIKQREGMRAGNGDVITYGVLDRSIVR